MIRNTNTGYGSVAKFFHWLIFLLLAVMIIFGFLLGSIPKEYQASAYNLHKLTGLSILLLMILRGIWALLNPKPVLPPDTKTWEKVAERTVHFLLYFAVIAMPMAGWIGSSAAGKYPHIGDFKFILPVEQNKAVVEAAFSMHYFLAIMIIVLVSIHVAAALFHHFIRRDNVLLRMLPGHWQS